MCIMKSNVIMVGILSLFVLSFCGAPQEEGKDSSAVNLEDEEATEQAPQQAPGYPGEQQQAPVDLDEASLLTFAKVEEKMAVIQRDTDEKMIGVIEEQGMAVEEYQQIMMMKQQEQQGQESGIKDVEAEKLEIFDAVAGEIQVVHRASQEEYMQLIEDEGLTVDQYQQIAMAVRDDPALREKVEGMKSDESGKEAIN